MNVERVIQILHMYIDYDVLLSEEFHAYEILTEVCGCSMQELTDLGFDYLIDVVDDML